MTRRRLIPAAAALVAAALLAGCEKSAGSGDSEEWTLDYQLKQLILGRPATDSVAMAFDPNDPDRRRQGILELSEEEWGLRERYLKGYAAILRTDGDPLVRAAAVRALGKAADPNYVENIARALFDEHLAVRQDAATALDNVHGEVAIDPLRNRAVNDVNQDVRAKSAMALRHYRREDVVRTLVECLGDKAFAVRYRAHQALVEILGEDRGYDPLAYRDVAVDGLPPAAPEQDEATWWDRLWQRSRKPSDKPPGDEGNQQ